MLIWLLNVIYIPWSSRILFPKKPDAPEEFCGLQLVFTVRNGISLLIDKWRNKLWLRKILV